MLLRLQNYYSLQRYLQQARSARGHSRPVTLSSKSAMTPQADKAILRQSVKQKLRQLPADQMQSESEKSQGLHAH